ncbi:uncharacterized protein [Onthophagus taurus]|uniref:uncharacterized protein n=1 Tax=Onthophagus taurus TaxID=166361 RepID=UPI0039BE39DC
MDTEPKEVVPPSTDSGSKKTVLKETPSVNANKNALAKQPITEQTNLLKEYFNSVANREVLHLNVKSVTPVLSVNLGIDLKMVSTRMKYVLAEALCYFMKVWPGWSTTDYKNPLLKDDCFSKYQDYLRSKLMYIIDNESQFRKDGDFQRGETVSVECQTDIPSKTNKAEAPFNLVITGQPSVLNNIVFIEVENNILIKQHLEKPWKQLCSMTYFLNHPYVKISVDLPKVRFSRSNVHVYKRYITDGGDTTTCPPTDFISEVVNTFPNSTPKVYSYDFISAYFKQLTSILTKYDVKNHLLIRSIFGEYLQDIKDCNMHGGTMAAPFMVTYNIGGKVYVRNKKMVVSTSKNKDANAINFCEILTPKVTFALQEFNVVEDTNAKEISFIDLNKIESMSKEEHLTLINAFNNCVTFHCTLCNKVYQGERCYSDCLDHFRFLHKGEQAVVCFKCRRTFEVINLASTRWAHNCQVTQMLFKMEDGKGGGEGSENVSMSQGGVDGDKSKSLNDKV